jgi:hypothetical protein
MLFSENRTEAILRGKDRGCSLRRGKRLYSEEVRCSQGTGHSLIIGYSQRTGERLFSENKTMAVLR